MAIETLKNDNIVEIIGNSSTIITTETIGLGNDARKRFSFSGRVRANTPTTIGTLRVDTAENKRFLKAPSLKPSSSNKRLNLNSNLKLKLKSNIKNANGNITACLYDIIYTGKEDVAKSNILQYNLIHNAMNIVTRTLGIDRVDFNSTYLNKEGGNRRITIYGSPNAEFEIAVNSLVDTAEVITHGDGTTSLHTTNSVETSVLSKSNSLHDNIKTLKDNLNSKGLYSFNQTFPKITTVQSTAIDGGVTDATRVSFDDLSGVQPGDELIVASTTGSVSSSTVIVTDPTGSKANECDLFSQITAVDGAKAEFKRKTRYAINIKPTILGSGFNTNGWIESPLNWGGFYSKILSQNINPTLKLQVTYNSVGTDTINTSGTDVTINTANPYDLIYRGRYNSPISSRDGVIKEVNGKSNSINIGGQFQLNYIFKTTRTLSLTKTPEFSNTKSYYDLDGNEHSASDWTNSVSADNGGTLLSIGTARAPVIDNTTTPKTCTIKFSVKVERWGTKDVTMSLNLNNIIGSS